MSLSSHIDNLREKPEHIRKRHAFGWALGFTLVVFAFWISSFSATGGAVSKSVSTAVNKVSTPTQSIAAAVGNIANDVWGMITGPRKVTYSTVKVAPGDK